MQCRKCPYNNIRSCGENFCILPACIMPDRPLRPCKHIGCTTLTRDRSGYCDEHRATMDRYRGTARERGYTRRWEKESKVFLRANPLCAECERQGRYTPAQVVDHIIPHRGNQRLFWDKANWQPLCKHCHDQKTARGE